MNQLNEKCDSQELQKTCLSLAKTLISKPSITPEDQGCQIFIAEQLAKLGFNIEHHRFGAVDNLWARLGEASPLLVFAGHTDVVPPGPLTEWESPPFTPTLRDGYLYGRGAADMKSSLAAMIISCERFLKHHPNWQGSIAFLLTSDEEGPAKDGTKRVLEMLQERHINIDYCIVGEPSSEEKLGDVVKVGRRGSLSGHLKIFGKQNHIAYALAEDNPIHQSFAALSELASMVWDQSPTLKEMPTHSSNDNDMDVIVGIDNKNDIDDRVEFPMTSFHISNLHAGTHATNVVPGILECHFNFRFSPKITPETLQQKVENIFSSHKLRYELRWDLSGLPFLTKKGKLRQVVSDAIQEITGILPTPSSMGGTSDARFIAKVCDQVIEFGPSRKTIHGINECVALEDIGKLTLIYERILQKLLAT